MKMLAAILLSFSLAISKAQSSNPPASATQQPAKGSSGLNVPMSKQQEKYDKKLAKAEKKKVRRQAQYLKRCSGSATKCYHDWRNY